MLLILAQVSMPSACADSLDTHSKPLRSLTPKYDTTSIKNELLQGHIEQLRNADLLLHRSDWNTYYSIGRQAFIDCDFKRAFNAFQLALGQLEPSNDNDPRAKMTRTAIEQSSARAGSLAAQAGYKALNNNKVEAVFPGSLAWSAGLKKGDQIVHATKLGEEIKIEISRDGKPFMLNLQQVELDNGVVHNALEQSPLLSKQQAQIGSPVFSGNIQDIGLFAKYEHLLDGHQLAVLVDKSGSMNEEVSPGKSKWQWCKASTSNMLELSRSHFKEDVSVITFDTSFTVFDHVTLDKIATIYDTTKAEGGTLPDRALDFILDRYFTSKHDHRSAKPLIVAILTDGLPNNPDGLRDVIYNATKRMHRSDEICVTFLQIGASFKGSRILTALDDYMVDGGAKYDIVDTMSFSVLEKIGMKNALISALLKEQPNTLPRP